jgi:hypothetical protein
LNGFGLWNLRRAIASNPFDGLPMVASIPRLASPPL